jgi:hypothetical protein
MRPEFVIFSFNKSYPLHRMVFEGDAILEVVWSNSHDGLVKEPEGVVLNSQWAVFQAEKISKGNSTYYYQECNTFELAGIQIQKRTTRHKKCPIHCTTNIRNPQSNGKLH